MIPAPKPQYEVVWSGGESLDKFQAQVDELLPCRSTEPEPVDVSRKTPTPTKPRRAFYTHVKREKTCRVCGRTYLGGATSRYCSRPCKRSAERQVIKHVLRSLNR